jgi:hypothetical protein
VFGIAGGEVPALMGFEMLFGGAASRTQGGKKTHEEPAASRSSSAYQVGSEPMVSRWAN